MPALVVAIAVVVGCASVRPTVCPPIASEKLNLYLSTFRDTVPMKVHDAAGRRVEPVEVAATFDLGAPPVSLSAATRAHSYVFMVEEMTCGAATFYVLVQVLGHTDPCLMKVVRTVDAWASKVDTCQLDHAREERGDAIYCREIAMCHVDLEGMRTLAHRSQTRLLHTGYATREILAAPKRKLGDDVKKAEDEAPEGDAEGDTEGAAEEEPGADADEAAAEEEEEEAATLSTEPFRPPQILELADRRETATAILKMLQAQATRRLEAFASLLPTTFPVALRRLYPFPLGDLLPTRDTPNDKLKTWLKDHAYQQVMKASALRFGDILLEFWDDERAPHDAEELWRDTKARPNTQAYRDRIAIYLGYGMVATYRDGLPTYEPMGRGYAAAYRLEPAFALTMFSIPGEMARSIMVPDEEEEIRAQISTSAKQPGVLETP